MESSTLQVGTFEVNCTLLSEGDKAWIVDPGDEAERIADTLAKARLTPQAILLTHAHFDHIGGIPGLQARFPGLPVFVGTKDAVMFGDVRNQYVDYPLIARPTGVRDATEAIATFAMEGIELQVLQTPGHTPGGVCYYFPQKQLLLSGDTLFAGSIGRTDLPGGDMGAILRSLESLTALPDETQVIPGHGPQTRIGAERINNPFLRNRAEA